MIKKKKKVADVEVYKQTLIQWESRFWTVEVMSVKHSCRSEWKLRTKWNMLKLLFGNISTRASMELKNKSVHGILVVGRDLWRSRSLTLLLKQVPCSSLHMKASSWVLNISRERDSTTSPDSLFQCSVTVKEVFPHVCMDIPMFQFVPIVPCSLARHH